MAPKEGRRFDSFWAELTRRPDFRPHAYKTVPPLLNLGLKLAHREAGPTASDGEEAPPVFGLAAEAEPLTQGPEAELIDNS